MDHIERIEREFTRQAGTFEAYVEKAAGDTVAMFCEALGEAGGGRVLDVACGPGAVVAALAGRAREAVGLDAVPAMLERARRRCEAAALSNARFEQGRAEALPFDAASFDAVVTRIALHHCVDPVPVLAEMFRVLRPGGRAAIAYVIVSEDAEKARLQNALEIVRDPSHIRMLPLSELRASIEGCGFQPVSEAVWEMPREFEEWMGIVNDPQRTGPLRTIARALAEEGRDAGMGLAVRGGEIVFFHRWAFIVADKPLR
ncbi:MAG: methyltransferase domain-containing protein [Alphaproteobacteria bacterium]|nr:methyltransferase domain-containing protein [Alphaproteobacteria bacterium]